MFWIFSAFSLIKTKARIKLKAKYDMHVGVLKTLPRIEMLVGSKQQRCSQ
jgi:hypothetical protein